MLEPGNAGYRHEMTTEYGAATLDSVFPYWRCPGCQAGIPDTALRVLGDVGYQTSEGLLRFTERYLEGLGEEDPPPCGPCAVEAELAYVDVHAHVQPTGRDLVARAQPGAAAEFLWWSRREGFVPVATLDADEERWFVLSALVRRAELLATGVEDGAAFVEAATAASGAHAGEPLLLELLPALLQNGRASVAANIAEAHVAAHPRDPRGFGWLAEILVICANHGALPVDVAAQEVKGLVARGLALEPTNARCLRSRALLHRLEGDSVAARRDYLAALATDPEQPEVHFNLGIMDLEVDPARALEHFRTGADLDPLDADYPLGSARALVLLERLVEAQEALSQARNLAPDHPRIPEIEACLPKVS